VYLSGRSVSDVLDVAMLDVERLQYVKHFLGDHEAIVAGEPEVIVSSRPVNLQPMESRQ